MDGALGRIGQKDNIIDKFLLTRARGRVWQLDSTINHQKEQIVVVHYLARQLNYNKKIASLMSMVNDIFYHSSHYQQREPRSRVNLVATRLSGIQQKIKVAFCCKTHSWYYNFMKLITCSIPLLCRLGSDVHSFACHIRRALTQRRIQGQHTQTDQSTSETSFESKHRIGATKTE